MDTESFYPKKMLGPLNFLLNFQLPSLQAFPRLSRRARRARAARVSRYHHNGDNTMATTIIAFQIITLGVYLELG